MAAIGFVLRPETRDAQVLLDELATWARGKGHRVVVCAEDRISPEAADIIEESKMHEQPLDVLVVLGGDGTMLRASRAAGDSGVPLLGINLGQLGFLSGFAPTEAQGALEDALAGKLRIEPRSRLQVTLLQRTGTSLRRIALNDAVLHQGAMARIVDVQAWIDDGFVAAYRADGLIVATPTGSTAYNMAAGGPILTPGAFGMTVTPICAHSLTNRPLVIPASSVVRLELGPESHDVVLTVDGQWAHAVLVGDRVEITAAPQPLRVFVGPQSYFDVMREKLHWGRRGTRPN